MSHTESKPKTKKKIQRNDQDIWNIELKFYFKINYE